MLRITKPSLRIAGLLACFLVAFAAPSSSVFAATAAKKLFGAKKAPAAMKPAAFGFYSKGCIAGAVAVPTDGPTWQAMRLERNRRWGHPDLVDTVITLSKNAKAKGWNGLLVGDLSQPRGGPMLTGHASHQIGLDADIWLTEMPNRTLTRKERRTMSATSMLARTKKGRLNQNAIGPAFTKGQFNLIREAARLPKVERVLVHPTIKVQLCQLETGDRKWLYKVRPYWGHHYHMHVRIGCPEGSPGCRPQAKTKRDDGCGADLAYWKKLLNPPKRKPSKVKKPKKPAKKRKPRRPTVLADLPQACAVVLNASAPGHPAVAASAQKTTTASSFVIPVPTPRPQLTNQ